MAKNTATQTTRAAFNLIRKLCGSKLSAAMCGAILNAGELQRRRLEKKPLSAQERQNPIAIVLYNEMYIPSASGAYRDLAQIFLAQSVGLKKRARGKKARPRMLYGTRKPDDEEYVSLRKFISLNTAWPPVSQLPEWLFLEPDIEQITSLYFYWSQPALDEALDRVCTCVDQGVPLYRRANEVFSVVPPDDGDSLYLAKKAQHGETLAGARHAPGCLPGWAEVYFFKWGHLRAREDYFGGWKAYHRNEAIETLRTAFRKKIGFDDSSLQPNQMLSAAVRPLVEIVSKTLAQYHRDGSFGPMHKRASIEKTVKNWLRETFGIQSSRQLDAVYVVTREAQEGQRNGPAPSVRI